MKLHLEKGAGNYIQSFTPGVVKVNGELLRSHLIVTPERIITDWSPAPVSAMTLDDFHLVLDLEPELILLGTGTVHQFANNFLVAAIMSRGVGFEVMGTAAACRTYNILVAEDRRVAAALIIA